MARAAITTSITLPMARFAVRFLLFGAGLGSCVAAMAQKPFFEHADTTFLLRDFREGYHAVFVEGPDRTEWHRRVAADPGDMATHKHVRAQMRALEELRVRPAVHADGGRLDRVGVNRLRGQWYLYAPNDWANHRQLQVSGPWLITNESGGALAHAIVGRPEPVDGEWLSLRCVSLVSHAMDPRSDTVAVRAWSVDPEAGVELWEFRDAYGDASYQLLVPLDRAQVLPVLVNHASARKAAEVEFEEPGPHLLRR